LIITDFLKLIGEL